MHHRLEPRHMLVGEEELSVLVKSSLIIYSYCNYVVRMSVRPCYCDVCKYIICITYCIMQDFDKGNCGYILRLWKFAISMQLRFGQIGSHLHTNANGKIAMWLKSYRFCQYFPCQNLMVAVVYIIMHTLQVNHVC